MKTSNSQKAKIGLFTVIGLLVLVGGIFFIGKKKSLFGNTFTVYGTFRNVGGLQVGNNVRFVGIVVGSVQRIRILNDTTARVDMRLQDNVKEFMKDNAVATIGSDGLMGDKLITINASDDATAKPIKPGQQMATVDPVSMDAIVAKLTNVADNAEVITDALAGISTQISQGKGSLGKLLYTDDLSKGLEKTVASANQTMKTIQAGGEGFSENMQAVKHNFLLRGYFKRKEREKQEKLEQQQKAAEQQQNDSKKTDKKKGK